MNDLIKTELTKATENSTNSRFDLTYFPQSNLLENALQEMFPEQQYEDKIVLRAKEVLGKDYSIEDVKSLITSFEYLITNWLEEYEKKVFDNKTLNELLETL